MLLNAILLALREIKRNIMRSFLTILGIVIGVSAVITMVTLGEGATTQITQQIASMGSNLLMVSPGRRMMGPGQASTPSMFKMDDVEAITRDIGSVKAVAPVSSQSVTVVYGNENWQTTVTGSNNNYITIGNRSIKNGRLFTETESRNGAAVCIIGETIHKELFGGQDFLGEKIRLKNLSCEIIGLLEEKGQSTMGTDQDDMVIIPLSTFQRRVSGNQDISLIQVSIKDGISTEKAQKKIELLMRDRRHISASEDDDFTVMDMKEIASMLTSTTRILTALLGAVAAVSLLVGGIGIMNIMMVSVTERTREIGTRLAIGAIESEVMMQFLVEAVVLSSFGGIIGIVLALSSTFFLARLLLLPFVLNWGIVIISFLFSAAVGVVFGYFPALKAARLDPIEALRHE
ncbi:MAG: ABC transporter permease [Sedimentisphaerales bacterium]|nr:ABC transporter permease [Sedimentisphaerales bacterium]